ncbi:MAG: hypothetical protein NC828_02595, partial [Candidatus Omnitrophica bacterium]|nr:hypothetical protein [Candidatus Omnitrophota bacterium]
MGYRRAPKRPRFLLILYGLLKYDGRAKRLLEVLKNIGDVFVVESLTHLEVRVRSTGSHHSALITSWAFKFRHHLRFWLMV